MRSKFRAGSGTWRWGGRNPAADGVDQRVEVIRNETATDGSVVPSPSPPRLFSYSWVLPAVALHRGIRAYNPASPMSFTPGATLGSYAIRAELGAGGMAVVYTAHDPSLKRQVAVMLSPDLTKKETANSGEAISDRGGAGPERMHRPGKHGVPGQLSIAR